MLKLPHRKYLVMHAAGLALLIFSISFPMEKVLALDKGDSSTLLPTDVERVRTGIEAPDFTLESFGGESVTLSSYRGIKNIVLVFYRGYW